MTFNFADMIEAVEAVVQPDRAALAHGDQVLDWAQLRRRSNNLAHALVSRGLQPGERCAFYAYNSAEYLVALVSCWKARGTHVNVNYRYVADELAYILHNSDAAVLFYARSLRDCVSSVREKSPSVRLWIEIGGDSDDTPVWAEPLAELADAGEGAPLDLARSPDDQFFLYTGGTTGLPKGVVWTHAGLNSLAFSALEAAGVPAPTTVTGWASMVTAAPAYPRIVCGPPLMHGTGLLTSYNALLAGGFVATLVSRQFDPVELLDAVDGWRADRIAVVGDAFAKPILSALDAAPDRWNVAGVRRITSSGVMWSQAVKDGLIRHMPEAVCEDNFSSSEAIGMGSSLTTRSGTVATATFARSGRCRVLDDEGRDVVPGSGGMGMVLLGPPTPLSYHKDAEKSERTFRDIDNVRYTISGDLAQVNHDGSIVLLGRGSSCINSAGEKIFPEQVEEALKLLPGISDAVVIGVADAKWGEVVCAVIQASPEPDDSMILTQLRTRVAGYKIPRIIVRTDQSLRFPNGKPDYMKAKALAPPP